MKLLCDLILANRTIAEYFVISYWWLGQTIFEVFLHFCFHLQDHRTSTARFSVIQHVLFHVCYVHYHSINVFCLHRAIEVVPSTLYGQIKEKITASPHSATNPAVIQHIITVHASVFKLIQQLSNLHEIFSWKNCGTCCGKGGHYYEKIEGWMLQHLLDWKVKGIWIPVFLLRLEASRKVMSSNVRAMFWSVDPDSRHFPALNSAS